MIRAILRNAGINPRRLATAIRGWHRYIRQRDSFRKLAGTGGFPWGRELPILCEWDEASGNPGAYYLQDQLVARLIHRSSPARHVDVGSRIDGFIGSLSVFREVEVIDIRPAPMPLPNVRFHQLDLMKPLPPHWLGGTDSLSCLHTIEHFGLGRYGDTLDPDGHLKGLEQLKKMVAPGGMFYLSTPIGTERIEFNAHRIFAVRTVLDWFGPEWEIQKFAVINDDNSVSEHTDWDSHAVASNFGCQLGVGIAVARRR